MRKNELISALQKIKGNPEIMVWNGFVEDFQAISKQLVESKVYKLSFGGYKERVNLERFIRDNLPPLSDDELKVLYKHHKIGQYEAYNYYPPDDNDKAYDKKTIYIIEPKATGKTHFDRLGSIEY